jgi:limonene-1,2-epoxide hydrolase
LLARLGARPAGFESHDPRRDRERHHRVHRVSWHGTHSGPLELPTGSVAGTNRSIDLRSCQVFEMSDGKARTIRHYFDMATLLQQLGIAG